VNAARQLDLFDLFGSCDGDYCIFPDCSVEKAFYKDGAWAFLSPISPLEAEPVDYALLVSRAAALFPLFDVFTRICSDPKLPLPQDYCSLFFSWHDNHCEDYFSQFSIEPISDQTVWKSEAETRRIFEELFKVKFPKSRPTWLKSGKGTSLELDGYNPDLKLAFEYQGEYHYMEVPVHHQERTLAQVQQTDRLKEKLCQKHGVTLIQVPYWEKGNRQFILGKLQAIAGLSA
jgi:hypothetical protein